MQPHKTPMQISLQLYACKWYYIGHLMGWIQTQGMHIYITYIYSGKRQGQQLVEGKFAYVLQ